jgi:transposase-like protein
MALVVLSKVQQLLDAMRAVLAGASVTEVAAGVGVSRVTLHDWLRRYLVDGLPGLADRSHRPHSCPHQVCDAVVNELRRQHPHWGRSGSGWS